MPGIQLRARHTAMSLHFPNPNRFYDATRRAVRFWGHDSAMEAVFFVTEDALKRIAPGMRLDETGCSAPSMPIAMRSMPPRPKSMRVGGKDHTICSVPISEFAGAFSGRPENCVWPHVVLKRSWALKRRW